MTDMPTPADVNWLPELPQAKKRNPTEAEVKEHARTHDNECMDYTKCLYEIYPWLA